MPVKRSPVPGSSGKPADNNEAASGTANLDLFADGKDTGSIPINYDEEASQVANVDMVGSANDRLWRDFGEAYSALVELLNEATVTVKYLEPLDAATIDNIKHCANLLNCLLGDAKLAVRDCELNATANPVVQRSLEDFQRKVRSAERQLALAEKFLVNESPAGYNESVKSSKASYASRIELITEEAVASVKVKYSEQQAELDRMEMEMLAKQKEFKQRQDLLEAQKTQEKVKLTTAALDKLDRQFSKSAAEKAGADHDCSSKVDWRNKCVKFEEDPLQSLIHCDKEREPHLLPMVTKNKGINKASVSTNDDIRESLAGLSRRLMLPPGAPVSFSGENIVDYMPFKASFEESIDRYCSTDQERYQYLLRYTSGEAREIVSTCFRRNASESYRRSIEALEEEYGNTYSLANHYKTTLENWPKLRAEDGAAFRKFSRYMQGIKNMMGRGKEFDQFNQISEMKMILEKLPVAYKYKFRDFAHRVRKSSGEVLFSDLADFIREQADIVNEPVFDIGADRKSFIGGDQEPRSGRRPRAFATQMSHESQGVMNPDGREEPSDSECCFFCGVRNHSIGSCKEFRRGFDNNRLKFVAQHRLCFGCLLPGHTRRSCSVELKCGECGANDHLMAMHGIHRAAAGSGDGKAKKTARIESQVNVLRTGSQTSIISPSVMAELLTEDASLEIGIALDSWASASFINGALVSQLGLVGVKKNISLTTMTSTAKIEVEVIPEINIRSRDGEVFTIKEVNVVKSWPFSSQDLPRKDCVNDFPHLQGLGDFNIRNIGLLLGNSEPHLVRPLQTVSASEDQPYAVRYTLGWALCGPFECSSGRHISCLKTSSFSTDLETSLNNFYNQDFNDPAPVERGLSADDKLWYQRIEDSIERLPSGHFQIALPFREDNISMPNNWMQARNSLNQLSKRFKKDETYARDYKAFMKKNLDKGYLKEIPNHDIKGSCGKIWYLVHHGIYHKVKKKIRIVFDCSRESAGISLNKKLLPGPDLMNKLIGVLLRFREHPVAVIADIKEMFMQVKVPPEQRDFLRVLWWPQGNTDVEPRQYQLDAHTFGAVSSPSVANYVVKRAAEEAKGHYSREAVDTLQMSTYVDDVMGSFCGVEEAIRVLDDVRHITGRAGFHLNGIVSNSRLVLASVPREVLADEYQAIDFGNDDLPQDRALGVIWQVHEDCFKFRVTLIDRPLTRRGLLSVIGGIYDPLGLISPVIVPARAIFQTTCKEKLKWDEELPSTLLSRWSSFLLQISKLENYYIPRCIVEDSPMRIELHLFCDGSLTAYAAVAYARLQYKDGRIGTSLLMSKTRQTPVSGTVLKTVPRIELNSAKLAVMLAIVLRREFNIKFDLEYFWSDSQTVLKYIRNENARLLRFVDNRVNFIRANTRVSNWFYVPGKINVADVASRGVTVDEFLSHKEWKHGPQFLSENSIPMFEEPKAASVQLEVKALLVTAQEKEMPMNKLLASTNNWLKLRCRIAAFQRLVKGLKTKEWVSGIISKEELEAAEQAIFMYEQRIFYKSQLNLLTAKGELNKRDPLAKCSPFVDDEGLMRAKGRFRYCDEPYGYKHPVILPGKSRVILAMVEDLHRRFGHVGRTFMMSKLQELYYISSLTKILKSINQNCFICRRVNGRPMAPEMADLPRCRVTPQQKAFWVVGLDFFGPFAISYGRGSSSRKTKCYGMIASCMTSRAIHIEIVDNMTLDCFLNALRRFMARRGEVKTIHCDNGTNLRGGAAELKRHFDTWNRQDFLGKMASRNIEWKFSPPTGSNFGGAWERDIRSIRKVLWSLCMEKQGHLTGDMMRTLMCEVESILNNRPLTPVVCQSVELSPLTPAHLLMIKPVVAPPADSSEVTQYTSRRWLYVQQLSDLFWTRFRKEYVPTLLKRQKWLGQRDNPEVGDLVLIIDKTSPRNTWPMGMIHEVLPGMDSVVRKVVVRVAMGAQRGGARTSAMTLLTRPVNKLIPVLRMSNVDK